MQEIKAIIRPFKLDDVITAYMADIYLKNLKTAGSYPHSLKEKLF